MYEVKEPFWQLVDYWQTLITGLLALTAAAVTIWLTKVAANRAVAAAQRQTAAAQQQTAVIRDIERRRIAREGFAFHAMLEAAMTTVMEDVDAARKLPKPSAQPQPYSEQAYAITQRVRRTGFNELRGAFVRFGGTLTTQFLRLDSEIEGFACAHMLVSRGANVGVIGLNVPWGLNPGIDEALARIEEQARALQFEAERGIALTRNQLSENVKDVAELE